MMSVLPTDCYTHLCLLVGGRPLTHLYSPEPSTVTANSAELHEIDNIRLDVTWNLYLQIINFMTPLHTQ